MIANCPRPATNEVFDGMVLLEGTYVIEYLSMKYVFGFWNINSLILMYKIVF